MCSSEGPYDLNIPIACSSNTTINAMVRRAVALGYKTIALNTEVNQNQFITRKEKNKKEQPSDILLDFPPPTQIELSPADYETCNFKPTILNRLTINMVNNDFMIAYNKSEIAKHYDILAINCASSVALTALLKSSFRFDILCFSPDQVVAGIKWNRKLYYECIEKNVHFELSYGPMVRSSVDRRRVISQAHTYNSVGKSRAILLTSEARTPMELRAPSDVANLGFLLGLKQAEGLAAVDQVGEAVHRAGLGRRMGPFRVRIEKLGSDNEHLAPAQHNVDVGETMDSET